MGGNMESWQLLLVVFAALAVGAALPLLYELRATLRATRRLVETAGPGLERALAELGQASVQVRKLAATLDEADRLERVAAGVDVLAGTLAEVRGSLKVATSVGAVVGPVLVQAIRTYAEHRTSPEPPKEETP